MQRSIVHRQLLRVVAFILPAVFLLGAAGPAAADTTCIKRNGGYVICV